MDELQQKIVEQDKKLDAIYESVEKTRKYFQITLWITVIMFILPLIGLIFIIPSVIGTYTEALDSIAY